MTNKQTKGLRLTEKALMTLRNVREISFRKTRSFSDTCLASGIEEIAICKSVDKKVKDLLIAFFQARWGLKRGCRVKTLSIHNSSEFDGMCIVRYRVLHGYGYSWSQDFESDFIDWILNTYSVKKNSKTYKVLLGSRGFFAF